jgi:peptide/nickel transport system permease protein
VRVILVRILQLFLVLFLVTIFTSYLIDAVPGDVTQTLAPVATPQQRQDLRHELHLDEPVYERYGEWVNGLVHGDLGCYYGTSGYSTASQCPDKVVDRVKDALPIAIQLMFYAQLLSILIAVPMGVLTAYRAGTLFDKTANTTAFALLAIPNFVLALLLAYYVGTKLGWVDPTGYIDFGQDPVGHFQQLALPVISLAVGQIAIYMRLLRSDMIGTLQENYILAAKAKGMPTWRILFREALRPSSFSLITLAGISVGRLIGGTVIVEQIFALPGLGRLVLDAITQRDYALVEGCVLFIAFNFLVVNLLVDLAYVAIDPRIRLDA